MKNILRIVLSFAIVFGAVVLASFFISPQASSWYASLAKPTFIPPDALFAPVWTVLYVLLAISLARVWTRKVDASFRRWCFAFGTQLVLNSLWSILFFSLHGLLLSVIDIVVLWFAVIVLTADSWELDRTSFWLLIPYLAWVTFAMFLNLAIWWMN